MPDQIKSNQQFAHLYISTCLVCLSVRLFVYIQCQSSLTDLAQILCGTSNDPKEGLWMVKITKIGVQKFLEDGREVPKKPGNYKNRY